MPVSVEVAFAAGPWDASPVWTTVTTAVGKAISAQIRRGRRANEGDAQPGTATVVLDDPARLLDPTNPASPYAANLVPMRQVRISQTMAAGAVERLFTGYVEDFSTAWAIGASESTLVCVDALAWAATQRLVVRDYASTVLADSPRAYYRLGDPLGSTVARGASPNGRHSGWKVLGIATGAFVPTSGVGAVLGDADGACDMGRTGTITLPPAVCPPGSALSVEMYIRKSGSTPDAEIVRLNGTSVANTIRMGPWLAATGRISLRRVDVTASTTSTQEHPAMVLDGQWHHVIWLRNADGVTNYLSVDGVVVGGVFGGCTMSAVVPPQVFGGPWDLDELAFFDADLAATNRHLAHYSAARGRWGWPAGAHRSGTRLSLVCDLMGWPAARRSLDLGVEDVMAPEGAGADELVAKSASAHMAEVNAVEGGRLFMTRLGVLRFAARAVVAPAAVATYRNDGGGLRFVHGTPSRRRADIVNHAEAARVGGPVQMAESASSVARYLRHDAPSRTGLYGDDQDAAAAARRFVAQGKESVTRIDELTVDARIGAAEETSCALRELGDVVAVRLTPPQGAPLDLLCAVEGISHVIDTGLRWRVTYDLSLMSLAQTPAAVVVAVPDTAWASGVYSAVTLPYEYVDTANLHTARGAPDRLTVPVAGDYLVTATAQVEGAAAGGVLVGVVDSAGATYGGHASRHNSGNDVCLTTTTVVRLAVGDTLRMSVLQTSGASKLVRFLSAYSPVLSAVRIG